MRNNMPRFSTIVFGAIVLLAILAPLVAPFGPAQQLDIVALKNRAPSVTHLLGTDAYSRDLLSRALFGARTSLFVAFAATTIATVVGTLWGGLAATVQSRSFVEAAHAAGSAPGRVFLRHIAPHLTGPLTAAGTLLLADILALESGLSFLGLGIKPPGASWGNMVQDALPYLGSAWWTAAVPCACLLVTVFSASALADQLQKMTRRDETPVPGL